MYIYIKYKKAHSKKPIKKLKIYWKKNIKKNIFYIYIEIIMIFEIYNNEIIK